MLQLMHVLAFYFFFGFVKNRMQWAVWMESVAGDLNIFAPLFQSEMQPHPMC